MALDPLNRLCKWRMVISGWHSGTKAKDQPGVQAMRDFADKWLVMRSEVSALANLLIKKRVFTAEEFTQQLHREAALLDKAMERCFPGFRSSDAGIEIFDQDMAKKTMADLGFPP